MIERLIAPASIVDSEQTRIVIDGKRIQIRQRRKVRNLVERAKRLTGEC